MEYPNEFTQEDIDNFEEFMLYCDKQRIIWKEIDNHLLKALHGLADYIKNEEDREDPAHLSYIEKAKKIFDRVDGAKRALARI